MSKTLLHAPSQLLLIIAIGLMSNLTALSQVTLNIMQTNQDTFMAWDTSNGCSYAIERSSNAIIWEASPITRGSNLSNVCAALTAVFQHPPSCPSFVRVSEISTMTEPGYLNVSNASFEHGLSGWMNAQIGNSEYFAAPDGEAYAYVQAENATSLHQLTTHTIQTGKTYTLTVWARSIYSDSYVAALKGPENQYPEGVTSRVVAVVELSAGSSNLASTSIDVSPFPITGAPESYSNDDGGNIWVDGTCRHAFSEHHFIQPVTNHPIRDPWLLAPDQNDYETAQEDQLGVCPVMVNTQKYLYMSMNTDEPSFSSDIGFVHVYGSGDPDYNWALSGSGLDKEIILQHAGDENPVVFDPHLYYDTDTLKLWMAWGGNQVYVSALNPLSGRLPGNPASLEFTNQPPGMHHLVISRSGPDIWTDDNEWLEGAAIWKHNGYWYIFGSYGNLNNNYTIRMGRSIAPIGPYVDKQGIPLTEYDPTRSRNGASFFLGDDTDQLVPGHAHFWTEGTQTFVGYDYRTEKIVDGPEPMDRLGIREVFWVNDWPTIWQPISVSFNADDFPAVIGEFLEIHLYNAGNSKSIVAFDNLQAKVADRPMAFE